MVYEPVSQSLQKSGTMKCWDVCAGPVPRHQAALGLALTSLLPGLRGAPQAYDPVFTAVDSAALTLLGFQARLPSLLTLKKRCKGQGTPVVAFWEVCLCCTGGGGV